MRRPGRFALGGVGLVAALAAAIAFAGGASVGQAGPRVVDPFTLTAAPSPANYGKHVLFTISFTNSSKQTLVKASLRGTASSLDENGNPAGTMTYDASLSTTSRGTCNLDPNNSLVVVCDYGNLESGAVVTSSFVYSLPAAASGVKTAKFDGTDGLTINEGGAGGCTPGAPCVFSPTPSSVSVPVQAATADQASDVFGAAGGTLTTGIPSSTKTVVNPTGTIVNVPGGPPTPASILEGLTDATVCGNGATPLAGMVTALTVSGFFPGGGLGVSLDLLASELPAQATYNKLVLCHDGAVVPSTKSKFKNSLNQWVYRLTGAFDSNGKIGGGF